MVMHLWQYFFFHNIHVCSSLKNRAGSMQPAPHFLLNLKQSTLSRTPLFKYISATNVNSNVEFSRESQAGTIIVQCPWWRLWDSTKPRTWSRSPPAELSALPLMNSFAKLHAVLALELVFSQTETLCIYFLIPEKTTSLHVSKTRHVAVLRWKTTILETLCSHWKGTRWLRGGNHARSSRQW